MSYSPALQGNAATPASTGGRGFSDLRLRTKMLALAGLAAAVTLVVGVTGQTALGTAQATTRTVAQVDAQPAIDLGRAALAFARYRRWSVTLIASSSPQAMAAAQDAMKKQRAAAGTALDAYAAGGADPALKQRLAATGQDLEAVYSLWDGQFEKRALAATDAVAIQKVLDNYMAVFVPAADKVSQQFDQAINDTEKKIANDTAAGEASAARATTGLWAALILGMLTVLLAGLWISKLVTTPVQKVRDALAALAAGDLTRTADVTSRDEIGEMAAALETAQHSLRDTLGQISTSAATLAGSAEELSVVSAQVAASAEETSAQSGNAAATAEQVSRNVQTVAAATEQMTSSIREISQNSSQAVKVARSAADEAQRANETVGKLGDSSREIGDVVKVITSIAEQTNLLALNATIEAARAGEAGKGFAVVATEVKDLAQETARATEDISRRIEAIQSDTDAAITAIGRIAEIIEEVNTYQTTIASAVEEQTATTSEMARNVAQAADGAGGIAGNIEYVASAAQASSTGVSEAQRSAGELAHLSTQLRTLVGRFTV